MAAGLFFFYRALAPDATFVKPNVFPRPRLQTRPDGLRDPEIARQQAELERFRWIDKSRGAFQIPIARGDEDRRRRAAQKPTTPSPAPPPLPEAAESDEAARSALRIGALVLGRCSSAPRHGAA